MTPEDAAAAGRGAAGAGIGALTRVGVRGGGTAVVDRAGRLQVGSHVVDWWIGADDRWHRPGAEVTVRQQRLQAAPVVETRLRLPGGDAVQRVYGARRRGPAALRAPEGPGGPAGAGRGGDHVVVEVVNESRLPVALTLTVGPGVAIAQEGAVTRMGGASVLLAPRPPSRVAGAPSEAALFDAVAGGRADEFDQVRHHDDPTGAFLALVWPLAHGATLRMAAPLGGSGPRAGAGFDAATSRPLELPSAEQVARGWRRQLEADVRIDLPDPGLAEAVLAARSELLLGGDGETAAGNAHFDLQLVRAGARWGDEEVVAAATARLAAAAGEAPRSDPSDQVEHHAALLGALAEAQRLGTAPPAKAAGDADEWCLSVVASAVARLDRALRRPARQGAAQLERYRAALADAAELLRRSGQAEAADHVGRLHRRPGAVRADAAADAAAARTFLEAALARASPTWTWADPGTGPEVLLAARRLLLDDRPPDGVALLPGWPARWWGAPVSFHRLPARLGQVSAALRWHGDRPALLWEIDRSARPGRSDVSELVPTVRAPALDPAWAATGWRGEALLAPVPPPPGQGDGAADRPDDGSFR